MSKVASTMSESACADATKSLKQNGIKEAFMKRIVRNSKRCNPVLTKGDMFLLKLRKRVARLYEMQRILRRRISEGSCQETDQVCGAPIQKLQLGDQRWNLHCVVTTIRSAQVELEQAESKIRAPLIREPVVRKPPWI